MTATVPQRVHAASRTGDPTSGHPLRHRSTTRRLITTELRLMTRDPLTLTFVLVFPIVTMLIIGGSFGTEPDEVFPVNPAHWYVASYFTVVIGATGLVMLPVHIASYRERGVLRRFAASGFPRWSFALAQLVVGLTAIAVAGALLLAVAAPVYGIPTVEDPLRVAAGVAVGAVAFVSIGVLLGTMLPSARAAQAVGLLLFFPSFLLGVGGPPPAVMSEALRETAERLPLSLANQAIREPWLGMGDATAALVTVVVIAAVAMALAARRTAL
jgi:ABC-2 type transport system permease protein